MQLEKFKGFLWSLLHLKDPFVLEESSSEHERNQNKIRGGLRFRGGVCTEFFYIFLQVLLFIAVMHLTVTRYLFLYQVKKRWVEFFKCTVRSLRAKSHNLILPLKDNRNFISRALYHAFCPLMG